ncbi:hypothetical protein PSU4_32220 [Pseudonocardia sulfidoxydans NBRC 16205]|uniref:UspA domain-containing protein n=2 Tax=Pseudonocardia sulfidoxydans TaxID=54011 RepID=A0A511DMH5_9PSEU|nr:universal stress protein [Pseudonocardia sulfidoxydans]GEL24268.1 hypothetical protein PSU4_32220 [Pseudonocardia sulfidoxydans NBRC 16205]
MNIVSANGAVVVGVDGSGPALAAARWAAGEARRRGVGLRVVTVVGWDGHATRAIPEPEADVARDALLSAARDTVDDAAAAAIAAAPDVDVDVRVRSGAVSTVLMDEADGAALLVVGNRGNGGFTGLLVGSAGVSVAAHARCPVVVVRGDGRAVGRGAPVVVGVGESVGGEAAVGFAFEEASRRGVPLVAVHAWIDPGIDPLLGAYADWDAMAVQQQRVLVDAVAPWTAKHPDVEVRELVVRDGAVRALVAAAEGAALVVVGSRGYGPARGLLVGSVSQGLLHHAPCPVAVVRGTG